MVVVGRKDLPPQDIGELITYIKANKDKITYGNGGVGSASHFCGLLLMSAVQAEMTTVSYRGSAPAMLDVLGGRLDLLCDQTTTTTSHMRAGTIKVHRGNVRGKRRCEKASRCRAGVFAAESPDKPGRFIRDHHVPVAQRDDAFRAAFEVGLRPVLAALGDVVHALIISSRPCHSRCSRSSKASRRSTGRQSWSRADDLIDTLLSRDHNPIRCTVAPPISPKTELTAADTIRCL